MCTSAAPSALASHHRLESSGHSRGPCIESPSQVASANAPVPDSPRLIHAGIYAHSGCSNVASRTRLIHAGIYAHSGCSNVASLGTRPAVESDGRLLLEVHVFDFNASVYGSLVRVEILSRLREERHYENLDLLVEQIHRDARAARDHFGI